MVCSSRLRYLPSTPQAPSLPTLGGPPSTASSTAGLQGAPTIPFDPPGTPPRRGAPPLGSNPTHFPGGGNAWGPAALGTGLHDSDPRSPPPAPPDAAYARSSLGVLPGVRGAGGGGGGGGGEGGGGAGWGMPGPRASWDGSAASPSVTTSPFDAAAALLGIHV